MGGDGRQHDRGDGAYGGDDRRAGEQPFLAHAVAVVGISLRPSRRALHPAPHARDASGSGPQVGPRVAELEDQLAQQRQAHAHHVVVVALDPVTNAPPKPSIVKAPATCSGSPVAT